MKMNIKRRVLNSIKNNILLHKNNVFSYTEIKKSHLNNKNLTNQISWKPHQNLNLDDSPFSANILNDKGEFNYDILNLKNLNKPFDVVFFLDKIEVSSEELTNYVKNEMKKEYKKIDAVVIFHQSIVLKIKEGFSDNNEEITNNSMHGVQNANKINYSGLNEDSSNMEFNYKRHNNAKEEKNIDINKLLNDPKYDFFDKPILSIISPTKLPTCSELIVQENDNLMFSNQNNKGKYKIIYLGEQSLPIADFIQVHSVYRDYLYEKNLDKNINIYDYVDFKNPVLEEFFNSSLKRNNTMLRNLKAFTFEKAKFEKNFITFLTFNHKTRTLDIDLDYINFLKVKNTIKYNESLNDAIRNFYYKYKNSFVHINIHDNIPTTQESISKNIELLLLNEEKINRHLSQVNKYNFENNSKDYCLFINNYFSSRYKQTITNDLIIKNNSPIEENDIETYIKHHFNDKNYVKLKKLLYDNVFYLNSIIKFKYFIEDVIFPSDTSTDIIIKSKYC